jgi:hypothetical protein
MEELSGRLIRNTLIEYLSMRLAPAWERFGEGQKPDGEKVLMISSLYVNCNTNFSRALTEP